MYTGICDKEIELLRKMPNLYGGLAVFVKRRNEDLNSNDIIKYIAEHQSELQKWCIRQLRKKYDDNELVYIYITCRILAVDINTVKEKIRVLNYMLNYDYDNYVTLVKSAMIYLSTIIYYSLSSDEYMNYKLYNRDYKKIKTLIESNTFNIIDFIDRYNTAKDRDFIWEIYKEYGLEECIAVAGDDVYLSVHKPVFTWIKKGEFSRINVTVVTASTASIEDKKSHIAIARTMVYDKLKKTGIFSRNPELLKHVKISSVVYCKDGVDFIIEWKESFAYE